MKNTKRFFLGLLLLAFIVIAVAVGGMWYFNLVGFNLVGEIVVFLITLLLTALTLVLLLGIVGILIKAKFDKRVKGLIIPTKIVISYFVPLVLEIFSFLGFDKEEIEGSFINLSNQLIEPEEMNLAAEDILILLPHCIQQADCDYRVTSDLNNCQQCGRCQVGDLLELKKEYGVHLEIATGGTLARKIIKDIRPKAIIAVACERDLSSGIQDIYPLPVIGVLNIRPHGPCFNTKVEMVKIEQAVKKLLA